MFQATAVWRDYKYTDNYANPIDSCTSHSDAYTFLTARVDANSQYHTDGWPCCHDFHVIVVQETYRTNLG